uniref:Uncharacterized protein n=1 Tax=Picea glauca TaxID=3330 RepID=A0A101M278_PICGL|nr:hypothetical protein ABT39_MTgene2844 [Picea glauca]
MSSGFYLSKWAVWWTNRPAFWNPGLYQTTRNEIAYFNNEITLASFFSRIITTSLQLAFSAYSRLPPCNWALSLLYSILKNNK